MSATLDIAARLDQLPLGRFHRRLIVLVGLGLFFDAFDNTLSSAVLASMLPTGFSTLELNSLFMSFSFAGLAVGAVFAGWLSDRMGRGFAFQFNLALFGVLALVAAAAPSMEVLIGLRFLMAIGMGAEYVICYGMVTEFIPRAHRGRYLGVLGAFGGVGVTMSSLVGWAVIPTWSWRAMFVIGGVGALIAWWLRRDMPESPKWLASRGRHAEAEAILAAIQRECTDGTRTTPSRSAKTTQVGANLPEPHDSTFVPMTVLFSGPVIKRTLVALALSVVCLFGSYSVTGWMPTFFVEQGMTVTSSLGYNAAIMSGYVAGPLLCMLFADRLGRRRSIILTGVLAALFAAMYPFMAQPVAVVVVGFVLVAMAAAFLTMALGTVPEMFPTAFRFRAGGLTQTVGRIGLIGSPFLVLALFNSYGIVGVILTVSGLYLAVTLVFALARIDTSHDALAQVAAEAVAGDPAMPPAEPVAATAATRSALG